MKRREERKCEENGKNERWEEGKEGGWAERTRGREFRREEKKLKGKWKGKKEKEEEQRIRGTRI